jgi:hypothetical protein
VSDGSKVAAGFVGGGAAYALAYALGASAEGAVIPGGIFALTIWVWLIAKG